MSGNVFVFKIRRKLWHPKCARKVSGVSRNRPLGTTIRRSSTLSHVRLQYNIADYIVYHLTTNQISGRVPLVVQSTVTILLQVWSFSQSLFEKF